MVNARGLLEGRRSVFPSSIYSGGAFVHQTTNTNRTPPPQVATCTYTWTRVSWFFFVGSLLLYLLFLFCYSSIPWSAGFFHVPEHMLAQAPHWLLVLLAVRKGLVD